MGVPAYFVFLNVLESFAANILTVPTDDQGLSTDALADLLDRMDNEGSLPRLKFIYDTTYFNNPSGISLSHDRRAELVRVLRRYQERQRILVVEDAAYREIDYETPPPPSLWSHDPKGDSFVYAGTFSKSFSPGMKSGFAIIPDDLVGPITIQKGHHDFGSSNLVQQLLAEAFPESYQVHLVHLREVYRRKRDAMLTALERELAPLAGQLTWTRPKGGLYVWLQLPSDINTDMRGPFFEQCVREGVLYVPGEFCYPRTAADRPRSCLRLCFGVESIEQIDEGIRRLARVVFASRRGGL